MKRLRPFWALCLFAALLTACGSSNIAVYTGPPSRNNALDTTWRGEGDFVQVAKPDSSLISFAVTKHDNCPVYISIHKANTKLIGVVVDSIYNKGEYEFWHQTVDTAGAYLLPNLYFYKFNICDSVYTLRLDLRPEYH